MRKIALAVIAFVSIVFSSSAFAQMMMPGDSFVDPGCNISVGGNCGGQLDRMNHTWRRLGFPLEQGRGQYGTYLPGGGFVPNNGPGYGYYTVAPLVGMQPQVMMPRMVSIQIPGRRRYAMPQQQMNVQGRRVPAQITSAPVRRSIVQRSMPPVTQSQMSELRNMYQ